MMFTLADVQNWRAAVAKGERGSLDIMDERFTALCDNYIAAHAPRDAHRTRRQILIMRAIEALTNQLGMPPTYREIAVHVGITSTGNIAKHIEILSANGYLASIPCQRRSVRIL